MLALTVNFDYIDNSKCKRQQKHRINCQGWCKNIALTAKNATNF